MVSVPELGILAGAAVTPEMPLPTDLQPLAPVVALRLAPQAHAVPQAHGDLPRWRAALDALPRLSVTGRSFGERVTVEGQADGAARTRLRGALMALQPWRKGPFSLFGVHVDSEWRSDWKWRRVAPHLAPLAGRRVLDVGCGNGYFGWRMLEAGAAEVVGVDPMVLFCLQHQAISRYLPGMPHHVLPVRFEELPDAEFDTVFSMGVVYHRREPQAHAAALFQHTRRGGQVVLESLVVEAPEPLTPTGRYARMRNVRIVPTTGVMGRWLETAGFEDPRLVDVTVTTTDEQRSTEWMRSQSLADALDPRRPGLTTEGHPAPARAVFVARKPV